MAHTATALSPRARTLAAEHRHLVTSVARATRRRLPPQFDLDELESAGALGLVDAARRFNRAIGVPFGAFARQRIRGAILDYLRQLDPLTRTQRRNIAATDDACFDVQLEWVGGGLKTSIEARTPDRGPDVAYAAKDTAARVRAAVDALPTRLRRVVVRRYYDQRTLRSLKRSMKVGDSRLSQLHTEALRELRQLLADQGVTAESLSN